MVIASPDVGGSKRASTYAKYFGVPLVLCHKSRAKANVVESMMVIGDVEGKNVILVDDMIDTAGTITNAANALKDLGAKSVKACATHGILSGPAKERIANSAIEELVLLNTVPLAEERKLDKMTFISVAPLLAETIMKIHTNGCVSELIVVTECLTLLCLVL